MFVSFGSKINQTPIDLFLKRNRLPSRYMKCFLIIVTGQTKCPRQPIVFLSLIFSFLLMLFILLDITFQIFYTLAYLIIPDSNL